MDADREKLVAEAREWVGRGISRNWRDDAERAASLILRLVAALEAAEREREQTKALYLSLRNEDAPPPPGAPEVGPADLRDVVKGKNRPFSAPDDGLAARSERADVDARKLDA